MSLTHHIPRAGLESHVMAFIIPLQLVAVIGPLASLQHAVQLTISVQHRWRAASPFRARLQRDPAAKLQGNFLKHAFS